MYYSTYKFVPFSLLTVKDPLTFEEAIASACRILELEPTIKFQSKIIQFIQLLQANSLVGYT